MLTDLCALVVVMAALTSGTPADTPATTRSGAGSVRVMSFNIRYGTAPDGDNAWPNRRELLFRTIEAFAPDVLGVQEALPFQAEELRRRLSGYGFVGAPRDDGKTRGELAGIYFRLDRFEQLRQGHFWLSQTPQAVGSRGWDADLPRVASWVELRDRQGGADSKLLVLNTHWDHRGRVARRESAKLIRSRLRELAGDRAVIVTGDFNTPQDSPPYLHLLGPHAGDPLGLIDSFAAAHPTTAPAPYTFHDFSGRNPHPSRIDWVLHSGHFRTRAASIDRTNADGRYPSDHFPVTAVLEWDR